MFCQGLRNLQLLFLGISLSNCYEFREVFHIFYGHIQKLLDFTFKYLYFIRIQRTPFLCLCAVEFLAAIRKVWVSIFLLILQLKVWHILHAYGQFLIIICIIWVWKPRQIRCVNYQWGMHEKHLIFTCTGAEKILTWPRDKVQPIHSSLSWAPSALIIIIWVGTSSLLHSAVEPLL